jgi:hypothetical protein
MHVGVLQAVFTKQGGRPEFKDRAAVAPATSTSWRSRTKCGAEKADRKDIDVCRRVSGVLKKQGRPD